MAAEDAILIVGGGVIGLGIGWRLARAGREVAVFEAGEAGRGASWAAAGILAAHLQASGGPLSALQRWSLNLWPDFAAELEAEAGMGVGYRSEGTVVVAGSSSEGRALRQLARDAAAEGMQWLEPQALLEHEPHLAAAVHGGLLSRFDHQVDNRRVGEALRKAFVAAGGRLHEHTPVRRIFVEDEGSAAIETEEGRHAAAVVILAAGAWSGGIKGLPPELVPPVRPVKGELLAVQMEPAAPLVRHVLWVGGAYLVPRDEGRLVVGATSEDRGFDAAITAQGQLQLLTAVTSAVPATAGLPLIESWCGFRPGTPDHAPILGAAPHPALIYATGHGHNGILMAAATIEATRRLVLEGRIDPRIAPFSITRFNGEGQALD